MKDSKLPTRSVVLTSKTQVLEAFRKVRLKLLWCFWGFVAVFLVGFALSFWLTQKDERWTNTFDNLYDKNWDFWSLERELSRNRSGSFLGSWVNYAVFYLVTVLPLSVSWLVLKSIKLLKMFAKKVQKEKNEPFDLTIVKTKTTRNFYLGMSFFQFLNLAGYTCKVIEEIKQDPKKQKEILNEEIVASIVKSSNRKFWGFFVLFAIFQIVSSLIFHSFIGIAVFFLFRSLNYSFKIFAVLTLWVLLEMFVFWTLWVSCVFLVDIPKKALTTGKAETFYKTNDVHWDEFFKKKRPKISLPIILVLVNDLDKRKK